MYVYEEMESAAIYCSIVPGCCGGGGGGSNVTSLRQDTI